MQKPNLAKSLLAGVAGTIAMTLLTYMAPMMGMPLMNIAGMLADFMKMSTIVGWMSHFMIGLVWALVYAYLIAERLFGAPWLRGLLFSLGPWFIMQVMGSTMMGTGVFFSSTSSPTMMVVGSLMGHIVYGAVLGAIYGSSKLNKSVIVPHN